MEAGFKPIPGAEGWQLSNAPVFNMAAHRASLDLFREAGMDALRKKSLELTGYLEFILSELSTANNGARFEVITPADPKQRGCQLSVLVHGAGRELFDALSQRGVIADWREPNVIRMAPVPLYNSFEDLYRFGVILGECLSEL
jgi:kynureninase